MAKQDTLDVSFRPKARTNRCVLWEGKVGQVAVRDLPFPSIVEPEDAIVRITTSAICGSERHTLLGFLGSPNVPYGLGHEAVGVVAEVGPAVDSLAVGDRVVISAVASDHGVVTENETFPSRDGTFGLGSTFGGLGGLQAEYARVPFADSTLIKIPKRLPDKEWLFLGDIFATAWQGLTWSGFEAGDSVAVFGAGPVGLLCAYSAVLRGASTVFVVDHVRQRLAKAASIGPGVIPIDFTEPGRRASDQILALSPGGVNRSVDCAGQECVNDRLERQQDYVLRECVLVTASGGGIGVPGASLKLPKSAGAPLADEVDPEISFPMPNYWIRGLSMKGGVADPTKTAATLVRLVESGRARPGFIVDEPPFDLDDAPELYRRFNEYKIIKVLFKGAPRPEEWEFDTEEERLAGQAAQVNGS